MKIQAPATPRQLFQLFQLYRPESGLDALADRINWNGVTPRQLYAAILGRLPGHLEFPLWLRDYSARTHFIEMLGSPEFQQNIIRNFLNAYPEKTRHMFVHIPKCAGTDFYVDLAGRYPGLPQSMLLPSMTPQRDLHAIIARLASDTMFADTLLSFGHLKLRWYLDAGLYRFNDRIFTIVREPVGIILSLVNYIVTVLVSDPHVTRVDTADWLAVLGETSIPPDLPHHELQHLARRVLHIPVMVQRNFICTYLGDGTADSTLDSLAATNIEICDVSRYAEWRQRVWNLPESRQENKSTVYLTAGDLLPIDQDYMMHLTDEDRRFYAWVLRALKRSAAPSFRGLDVVRKAMRDTD